jgi:7,8-dihydropterin-6-yl-methyl-4-(beta-D-ribofuranosyl)aminobenzene 5'-phosphate synthase
LDVGDRSAIVNNSIKLKTDLTKVDYLVFSHNHYDHTGGLKYLKDILNYKTNLIIGKHFFKKKYKVYKNGYKKLYNNFINYNDLHKQYEIIFVNNLFKITENVFVLRLLEKDSVLKNYFYIKDEFEKFIPDKFYEEIVLIIKNENELTVITGCSHTGVENIIETINKYFKTDKIKNIIGGLHLKKVSDEYFNMIVELIKNNNIKLFPGHCTGSNRIKQLEKLLKNSVEILHIGKEIVI